jgi:hypothetical protein
VLIKLPENSFNHFSHFVAAAEVCMQFSTVLPMGRSTITSSSQLVPCSDSNTNSITYITSVKKT